MVVTPQARAAADSDVDLGRLRVTVEASLADNAATRRPVVAVLNKADLPACLRRIVMAQARCAQFYTSGSPWSP